jgi:serine/threonine protein kinase
MLSDRLLDHLRGMTEGPDLSVTRYELVRELGRGGMGVVYLAHDTVLGRDVALKIVNDAQEALTLASLEHPGVVPVHDAGVFSDGRAYYAMKFVQGTRLDDYLEAAPSVADKLRVFLRICEPVAFAHSRGIVHRDLKPENVMIGAFGEVLVLDWGIAVRANTPAVGIAGTHGYMPPEQLAGITDVRNDVYALGKILDHLLTSTAPKAVRAIAARASEPDVLRRYASVSELTDDIVCFLDSKPVRAYPESPFERAGRWTKRNKTLVALILTYLLVRSVIFFLIRR